MLSLKQRQLSVLEETVATYNLGNRSVSTDDTACTYFGGNSGNPETSPGCAVERLIPAELAKHLDKEYTSQLSSSVEDVFDELPNTVKELGNDFLSALQVLITQKVIGLLMVLVNLGVRKWMKLKTYSSYVGNRRQVYYIWV